MVQKAYLSWYSHLKLIPFYQILQWFDNFKKTRDELSNEIELS